MVLDISLWMEEYIKAVKGAFGSRVAFVGLQGSYARNEATEDSDIDVVLILDQVAVPDLKAYDAVLSKMPYRDKICGFISGRLELLKWDTSDLFQFYHDTTPFSGNLADLIPEIGKEAVLRAVRIGACNIYHMCGHNIVHEKSPENLKALYKSAVFVLQAAYYADTGTFIRTKGDLFPLLSEQEQQIVQADGDIRLCPQIRQADFEAWSGLLFAWAGHVIRESAGT
ncbi:MAG: nucleotidyltransferase domain-containing protein [Candidatus Xenobiia bacterium LiM19]